MTDDTPSAPIALGPPADGDFDRATGRYIALVAPVTDAVSRLETQRDVVVARLAALAESRAAFRYAPDKWTIKEVIGHLSDAERVFGYRLLRIARGDATPLAGFDEKIYVPAGAFDRRSVRDLMEEWRAVRHATVALAHGLPREAWNRRGVANSRSVTAAALLYIVLGHVEHHLKILEERYDVRPG